MHLICRLQLDNLRAWKKRSLQAKISVEDRIRPQAYSSSSSAFRSYLDSYCKKSAVLWIITSYTIPGFKYKVASLAAKIKVKQVFSGDCDHLPKELKNYVIQWKDLEKEKNPKFCRIAEAEPTESRFFPVNDMTKCLSQLHYINRDGKQTEYSARRVLRIRPEDACQLEKYADNVARRTVFISYKHSDFKDKNASRRPTWKVLDLAGALISENFGVWLDVLCAPQKFKKSKNDLNLEEVRLLLKEGHAQSALVIGIETENYLTAGETGENWTLDEYKGSVGGKRRDSPLLRFVLHGSTKSNLRPSPKVAVHWSDDLNNKIVPCIDQLIKKAIPAIQN